jgi:hypothetical protein
VFVASSPKAEVPDVEREILTGALEATAKKIRKIFFQSTSPTRLKYE